MVLCQKESKTAHRSKRMASCRPAGPVPCTLGGPGAPAACLAGPAARPDSDITCGPLEHMPRPAVWHLLTIVAVMDRECIAGMFSFWRPTGFIFPYLIDVFPRNIPTVKWVLIDELSIAIMKL